MFSELAYKTRGMKPIRLVSKKCVICGENTDQPITSKVSLKTICVSCLVDTLLNSLDNIEKRKRKNGRNRLLSNRTR